MTKRATDIHKLALRDVDAANVKKGDELYATNFNEIWPVKVVRTGKASITTTKPDGREGTETYRQSYGVFRGPRRVYRRGELLLENSEKTRETMEVYAEARERERKEEAERLAEVKAKREKYRSEQAAITDANNPGWKEKVELARPIKRGGMFEAELRLNNAATETLLLAVVLPSAHDPTQVHLSLVYWIENGNNTRTREYDLDEGEDVQQAVIDAIYEAARDW